MLFDRRAGHAESSDLCPLLAQSGHPDAHNQCPLLGVKRTFGPRYGRITTRNVARKFPALILSPAPSTGRQPVGKVGVTFLVRARLVFLVRARLVVEGDRGQFRCPLLGVKRTSAGLSAMSAFDPKRTFCGLTPNVKAQGLYFILISHR